MPKKEKGSATSSPFVAVERPFRLALLEAGSLDSPRTMPEYQRRFSWNPQDIDRLLRDAELIATRRNGGAHFVGAMVFSGDGDGGHSIIDGQQRLTTLVLILLVAGTYLSRHAKTTPAIKQSGLDYIATACTTSSPPKLLVQPDDLDLRQSHAVVETLRDLGLSNGLEPFPSLGGWKAGKYWSAFEHLRKKFWDDGLKPAQIRDMVDSLLDDFVVARIRVKDPLWGAQVFSSLNDTGQQLQTADLVRVFLYSRFPQTETGAHDASSFMKNEWKAFEAEFGGDPNRLDDFYYTYAAAVVNLKVTRGTLLTVLKDHWKDNHSSASDTLDELRRWASPYKLISDQSRVGRDGHHWELLEALRRLQKTPNAKNYWPYALRLVEQALRSPTQAQKRAAQCLRTMEAYVVRLGLAQSQVTGIRSPLLDLWGQANDSNQAVRSFIGDLDRIEGLRGPSNKELRASLTDISSNYYAGKKARYVLAVRERTLRAPEGSSIARADMGPKTDPAPGRASFSVVLKPDSSSGDKARGPELDHIYPQNANEDSEWALADSQLDGEPFSKVVHSLGNLTLLEYKLHRDRTNATVDGTVNLYGKSGFVDLADSPGGAKGIGSIIAANFKKGDAPWTIRDMRKRSKILADWIIDHEEGWAQPWD